MLEVWDDILRITYFQVWVEAIRSLSRWICFHIKRSKKEKRRMNGDLGFSTNDRKQDELTSVGIFIKLAFFNVHCWASPILKKSFLRDFTITQQMYCFSIQVVTTSIPPNEALLQLYRVLQKASLLAYYDILVEMGKWCAIDLPIIVHRLWIKRTLNGANIWS